MWSVSGSSPNRCLWRISQTAAGRMTAVRYTGRVLYYELHQPITFAACITVVVRTNWTFWRNLPMQPESCLGQYCQTSRIRPIRIHDTGITHTHTHTHIPIKIQRPRRLLRNSLLSCWVRSVTWLYLKRYDEWLLCSRVNTHLHAVTARRSASVLPPSASEIICVLFLVLISFFPWYLFESLAKN
jgi:hypothetical protein